MRHGRAKAARRTLDFFARTAGIKAPYNILLDPTFVVAVLRYKHKEEIHRRLDKLLQQRGYTLCITACALEELKALSAAAEQQNKVDNTGMASLFEQAYQWAREECAEVTEDDAKNDMVPEDSLKTRVSALGPASKNIFSLVTSKTGGEDKSSRAQRDKDEKKRQQAYFLASQDEELLDLVRQTGSVPVIRLARGSVLLLEQPSKSSCFAASQQEKKKWSIANTMNSKEKLLVDMVKEEDRKNKRQLGREHRRKQQIAGGFTQRQSRKKRKAKEPNPLSCKKKKQRH